jgi:hypothetical protein
MKVAALFNPISNFRLHFETAHSAFPLDKDSEKIRSQNLQSNESSRDCCRGIVRSETFLSLFNALRKGGMLSLSELFPAMQSKL